MRNLKEKKEIGVALLAYMAANHKNVYSESIRDDIPEFWNLYKTEGSLNLQESFIEDIVEYYFLYIIPWYRSCLVKNKGLGVNFCKAFGYFETI